jgi:hypothetical protein
MDCSRTTSVVLVFAFAGLMFKAIGVDLGLWICVGGIAGAVVRHDAG